MRLAAKIVGVVMGVLFVLLSIDSYLSVKQEVKLFENDMQRDAERIGWITGQLLVDAWQTRGPRRALELLEQANHRVDGIRIRWVWLAAPQGTAQTPRVSRAILEPVARGQVFSVKRREEGSSGHLYTYVPVALDPQRLGALELSEPLSESLRYARRRALRSLILISVMAVGGGLAMILVANKIVRRPLERMIEKAERIGAGDLSGDLPVSGGDELSEVAAAMNAMCRQLAAAREATHAETEARIAAVEQLRHVERLSTLGKLASGVAHEMGTPLNVVAGRAKFIASGDLPKEEVIECARIIGEQASRMTRIIRGLLGYARRRPTVKSPVHLLKTVHRVFTMLGATAQKAGVDLSANTSGDIPPVPVDEAQMEQVLTNLVLNGIQAMPRGGQLEVAVGRQRARPPSRKGAMEKEYLTVHVRDQGEGISEDTLVHVFDPFFTTKGAGQGTGLGLSITQGIVEDHGGWTEVSSQVGQGTQFTIYLPLEAGDEGPNPDRG